MKTKVSLKTGMGDQKRLKKEIRRTMRKRMKKKSKIWRKKKQEKQAGKICAIEMRNKRRTSGGMNRTSRMTCTHTHCARGVGVT